MLNPLPLQFQSLSLNLLVLLLQLLIVLGEAKKSNACACMSVSVWRPSLYHTHAPSTIYLMRLLQFKLQRSSLALEVSKLSRVCRRQRLDLAPEGIQLVLIPLCLL